MIVYEIRTPFGKDGESFHKAKARISIQALEQLNVTVRWKKGRDKLNGRYHFWEVADRGEAMAFLLAFGDQIREKQIEEADVQAIAENMVKE